MRHDPVDQPYVKGLFRRKWIARQEQLKRTLATGKAREALGSAKGRRHAKLDFRLRKHGVFARDGQMGGLGDLATAAEGDPIDGHDHRLGKSFEARGHRLAAPYKVPHRYVPALPHAPGKFRDVTTSGEGTEIGRAHV